MGQSSFSSIIKFEVGFDEPCYIIYFDDVDQVQNVQDQILELYTEGNRDLIGLKNGLVIPVDRILSINGNISPNYTDDFEGCSCK